MNTDLRVRPFTPVKELSKDKTYVISNEAYQLTLGFPLFDDKKDGQVIKGSGLIAKHDGQFINPTWLEELIDDSIFNVGYTYVFDRKKFVRRMKKLFPNKAIRRYVTSNLRLKTGMGVDGVASDEPTTGTIGPFMVSRAWCRRIN